MRRRNNKGYFSPVTITALLLALLIAGLPFIASGPVKDDDILTPLPTPETTAGIVGHRNYKKAHRCITRTVCFNKARKRCYGCYCKQ